MFTLKLKRILDMERFGIPIFKYELFLSRHLFLWRNWNIVLKCFISCKIKDFLMFLEQSLWNHKKNSEDVMFVKYYVLRVEFIKC